MAFRLVQDNLRAAVLKMVRPSMDALGSAIVEKARELVPVDTGQLRDSIGYVYRQDTAELQIFADAPWAVFVEYGTSKMPAQPYLRPALMAAPDLWKTASSVVFQLQTTTSHIPAKARMDQKVRIRERKG
jgi:HK97 gp10 family phage protein